MIPDKIYIDEDGQDVGFVSGETICYADRNEKNPSQSIEFTRTPIAKRFSECKPEKDGYYWVKSKDGEWTIAIWDSIYNRNFGGFEKDHRRFPCELWAEIITPIVES